MFGHILFHVFGVVGYDLLAKHAATIVGYQHIVFQSDAAEVFVSFDEVEVKEVFAVSFGSPIVDKVGNEVYSWFIRNHKALFKAASHAQGRGAELGRRLYFVVVAHVFLV